MTAAVTVVRLTQAAATNSIGAITLGRMVIAATTTEAARTGSARAADRCSAGGDSRKCHDRIEYTSMRPKYRSSDHFDRSASAMSVFLLWEGIELVHSNKNGWWANTDAADPFIEYLNMLPAAI